MSRTYTCPRPLYPLFWLLVTLCDSRYHYARLKGIRWRVFHRHSSRRYILCTMFERSTEKARRVIFFARYQASQFGSPYIETEHLLLGLLRENKELSMRFLRSHDSVESIRKQIEAHTIIREKVSTSVDLPLSNESKRVLCYAAEEAERLAHKYIGSEHLFLGLLREEGCFAASILKGEGIDLASARARITQPTTTRREEFTNFDLASVSSNIVPPSCTFICDGAVVASVVVLTFHVVPRVGERVVLRNKEATEVIYRVEELTYEYERDTDYEREAPSTVVAPHQLANVVIRVKRE